MILLHGINGNLGKALLAHLLEQKSTEIVVIQPDDAQVPTHYPKNILLISAPQTIQWIRENGDNLEACILLDDSKEHFLNQFSTFYLSFFKQIWRQCIEFDIPFIYSSTYETYGEEGQICEDSELTLSDLRPTSPLGQCKHTLDQWVVNQAKKPYFWASLKLAEQYMLAEVPLFEELQQAQNDTFVPMVSVQDTVSILFYLLRYRRNSGIYHVTSNQWLPLSFVKKIAGVDQSTSLLGLPKKCTIKTSKLRNIGYSMPFHEIPVRKSSTVLQA
ncbi:MAG: NAD-dependent epimerase/dehydratase family protein [Spirosomataceae bacterium]